MQAETNYIGEHEITGVLDTGITTKGGDKYFEVLFSGGKKKIYTDKIFKLITTPQQSDATTVNSVIVKYLTEQVLFLMAEADITISQVNPILDLVVASVNDNFEKAANKLWNVEYADDRTFLDADKILKNGQSNP